MKVHLITLENYVGNCPECGCSWDSGETSHGIKISRLCEAYVSDGPVFDNTILYQCPECYMSWDRKTGRGNETFKQLYEAQIIGSELLRQSQEAAERIREEKKLKKD